MVIIRYLVHFFIFYRIKIMSNKKELFSTIYNPETKRFIKTTGKTSNKLLHKYVEELIKNPKLYNYLKQKISRHS